MTPCPSCNWSRHDVSIHGDLCAKGHPLEIVGMYTQGQRRPVCRECQREASRRYAATPRGQETQRLRNLRKLGHGAQRALVGSSMPERSRHQRSAAINGVKRASFDSAWKPERS